MFFSHVVDLAKTDSVSARRLVEDDKFMFDRLPDMLQALMQNDEELSITFRILSLVVSHLKRFRRPLYELYELALEPDFLKSDYYSNISKSIRCVSYFRFDFNDKICAAGHAEAGCEGND